MDAAGNGRGLFQGTTPAFARGKLRISRKAAAITMDVSAGIRTGGFPEAFPAKPTCSMCRKLHATEPCAQTVAWELPSPKFRIKLSTSDKQTDGKQLFRM
jgi:hypothetical protein